MFAIAFSFSSASARVGGDIHSSVWRSSFIACSIPSTISRVFRLSSGEKFFSTKTCPSASPRSRSTHRTQRFHRGGICSLPVRYLP